MFDSHLQFLETLNRWNSASPKLWHHREEETPTRGNYKLVVGQKVTMRSGDLLQEGTVEEVGENYVRVEFTPKNETGYAIDFRYDGTQCGGWVGGVDEPRSFCTGFGPWRLTLTPDDERGSILPPKKP